jgi:hypothetical protein
MLAEVVAQRSAQGFGIPGGVVGEDEHLIAT